jgi:predicted nucleic acid-binding protein
MAGRTEKPIERRLAFWDSSALVPLCVRQDFTPRALLFYKKYDAVVWWATPVEIASAIARLVRMKQLDRRDWAKARRTGRELADEWFAIQPSDALRARAFQLVDSYDLRAADALQLAAALEWCKGDAQGQVFLTADEKLREAAVLVGFTKPE